MANRVCQHIKQIFNATPSSIALGTKPVVISNNAYGVSAATLTSLTSIMSNGVSVSLSNPMINVHGNVGINKSNAKMLYTIVELGFARSSSIDNTIGFSRDFISANDECIRLQNKKMKSLGESVVEYLTNAQRSIIYNTVTQTYDVSLLPYNEHPTFFKVVEFSYTEHNKVFYIDPNYLP